jgi:hypothetical protein
MNEPKIVNLDDLNKSVTITLGGKSFTISRVTLEMRQLYGEYLIFNGEYLTNVNKMSQSVDEPRNSTAPSGIRRIYWKLFPRARVKWLTRVKDDMGGLIEEFAIGKAERLIAMMTTLLEKNGYKFDQKWFESNTDFNGLESFIVTAINKDTDTGSKKKEAAS